MDLSRDIDSFKRRLKKIIPAVNPPKLKMKNPEQLREDLIDDLAAFDKDYLIRSIICFLDHSQREELKDSIDREIF